MIVPLCAVLLAPSTPLFGPPELPPRAVGSLLHAALERDAQALYMEHCSSCHGEDGDGNGTAELDRPARSFLDGGYSYGNTETAVVRSVTHGIPGTPMPSFGDTLTAGDIKALASYVIELGPPGTVVKPGESVLNVGERPIVIQGMMPGLDEGDRREPRSVVVGFPNGTTFQYRATTMELVAIRVGEFLDRRDWGGRGGTELEPLGAVAWRPTGEGSMIRYSRGAGEERETFTRRYAGAKVSPQSVSLNFDLLDESGVRVGGGNEFLAFEMVAGVPVAQRSCLVNVRGNRVVTGGGEPLKTLEFAGSEEQPVPDFVVSQWGDGVFALQIDSETAKDVVSLVYVPEWTEAVESAVRESIMGETQEDR